MSCDQDGEAIYSSCCTIRQMERAECLNPLRGCITDICKIGTFLALAEMPSTPAGGTTKTTSHRRCSAPLSAFEEAITSIGSYNQPRRIQTACAYPDYTRAFIATGSRRHRGGHRAVTLTDIPGHGAVRECPGRSYQMYMDFGKVPDVMNSELSAWLRSQRQTRGWPKAEMARRLVQAGREAGDKSIPSISGMLHNIHRWEREGGVSERHKLHYCRALSILPSQFGPRPGGEFPDAAAVPDLAAVAVAAAVPIIPSPAQSPARVIGLPGPHMPASTGIAYREGEEPGLGHFAIGQVRPRRCHRRAALPVRMTRSRPSRPKSRWDAA